MSFSIRRIEKGMIMLLNVLNLLHLQLANLSAFLDRPAKRHRYQNQFDVLAGGGLGRR